MAEPQEELERHPEHLDFRAVDSVWDELSTMHDAIMRRAYQIFNDRSGTAGRDLDDWLAAERDLTWKPSIELTEKDGRLTLEAAVAGFDPDELDVRVTPEQILIQSDRTHPPPAENETVHRCEFARGRLFREVRLPARINPEQARVEYRNGLLRVIAPIEGSMPKRIKIAEA